MNYLLSKETNYLKRVLNIKYIDEEISKIELNWWSEATIIPAPVKTVKIPNIICSKMIKPKIFIALKSL